MHYSFFVALFLGIAGSAEEARTHIEGDAASRARLARADQAFESADFDAAESGFRDFLAGHPGSSLVPGTLFKLASVLALEKKQEDAQAVYEQLVREHFHSPWTQLALRTVYTESQLFDSADTMRSNGLKKDRAQDLETANEMLTLYVERFPQHKRNKGEILFKMNKLASAMKEDKDDKWSKLADIVLDGRANLAKHVDELMEMAESEPEAQFAFLRLSRDLTAETTASPIGFCRARCLEAVGKTDEAAKLYHQIEKSSARAKLRASVALRQAEAAFSRGDFQQAKAAYARLARRFPSNELAPVAKRWSESMDDVDSSWKSVEEIIMGVQQRLAEGQTGIAFALERRANKERKPLRARLSYDNQDLYFNLERHDEQIIFLSNSAGCWYRTGNREPIHKSKEPPPIPGMKLNVTADSEHGRLFLSDGIHSGDSGSAPSIQMTSDSLHGAIARIRRDWHLQRTTRRDAKGANQFCYRFECAPWHKEQPTSFEVLVDDQKRIRSIKITQYDGSVPVVWSFTDVRLAEHLSDEYFKIAMPPNVPIQETVSVNILELGAQLLHTLGAMWEEEVVVKPGARMVQSK